MWTLSTVSPGTSRLGVAESSGFSGPGRSLVSSDNAARVWCRRMPAARMLATAARRWSGVREDWSSHGAPPGGVAHSDLRLATGAVSGVNRCWRGERPRRLYLLTYPAQVRYGELGSERDQPANFLGFGKQRFGEFWREISGCGRNLEGPFRTPEVLSRNRERGQHLQIAANPCQTGQEHETHGSRSLDAGR